jgi:hypothetical protein
MKLRVAVVNIGQQPVEVLLEYYFPTPLKRLQWSILGSSQWRGIDQALDEGSPAVAVVNIGQQPVETV